MESATIYRNLLTFFNKKYAAVEKNIYFYTRESDILFIGKDDLTTEVEVKVGKQDFRRDFKKGEKHNNLSGGFDQTDAPNYFYFAAPKGMVSLDEIPEYAGLIEIVGNSTQKYPRISKKAPLIHSRKLEGEDYKKLYHKTKR